MDEEENGLMIEVEFNTKLIRLINNSFIASNFLIRAELIPLVEKPNHDEFDISMSKCRFWIDNIFSRCIAFYKGNTDAAKILLDENGNNLSSNHLMITPMEPTDDHIACLLQSKLSALSNDQFTFGSVKVRSDSANGLIFRFLGDSDDVLPSMKEWIGERTYFEEPWWKRDDVSTLDVIPSEDADLNDKPDWASNLDALVQALRGSNEPVKIMKADFKPKIIHGGKDDKDK